MCFFSCLVIVYLDKFVFVMYRLTIGAMGNVLSILNLLDSKQGSIPAAVECVFKKNWSLTTLILLPHKFYMRGWE